MSTSVPLPENSLFFSFLFLPLDECFSVCCSFTYVLSPVLGTGMQQGARMLNFTVGQESAGLWRCHPYYIWNKEANKKKQLLFSQFHLQRYLGYLSSLFADKGRPDKSSILVGIPMKVALSERQENPARKKDATG